MATKAVAIRRRRAFSVRRSRSHSRTEKGGFSLAVMAGFIPALIDAWNVGNARTGSPGGVWAGAGHQLLLDFTGLNTDDHKWYPSRLFTGWGPVIAGMVVHVLANKVGINRQIRKFLPVTI